MVAQAARAPAAAMAAAPRKRAMAVRAKKTMICSDCMKKGIAAPAGAAIPPSIPAGWDNPSAFVAAD
jgi:hypothetical protein